MIQTIRVMEDKRAESDKELCHLLSKSSKTVICFINKNFYSKILTKNIKLNDLKMENPAEISLPEQMELSVGLIFIHKMKRSILTLGKSGENGILQYLA